MYIYVGTNAGVSSQFVYLQRATLCHIFYNNSQGTDPRAVRKRVGMGQLRQQKVNMYAAIVMSGTNLQMLRWLSHKSKGHMHCTDQLFCFGDGQHDMLFLQE